MALHLAIDTASLNTYVTLANSDGEILQSRVSATGESHNELLASMVFGILHDASAKPSDLDRIIFGVGPGSFTGLRIGAAFISGMVCALEISAYTLDSFSGAAAAAARRHSSGSVIIAADARRDEVFFGHFALSTLELLAPITIMTIDDAKACADKRESASVVYSDVALRDLEVFNLATLDRGEGLARLYNARPGGFRKWDRSNIGQIELQYLRAVSARTIEERQKKVS